MYLVAADTDLDVLAEVVGAGAHVGANWPMPLSSGSLTIRGFLSGPEPKPWSCVPPAPATILAKQDGTDRFQFPATAQPRPAPWSARPQSSAGRPSRPFLATKYLAWVLLSPHEGPRPGVPPGIRCLYDTHGRPLGGM